MSDEICFVFLRESLAPHWILNCSFLDGPSIASKIWMMIRSQTSQSVPMEKWCSSGELTLHHMWELKTFYNNDVQV